MAKGKTQTTRSKRLSTSQIVFLVLTLVIIISFVLSLLVNI
jgi:hypothetical protein